MLNIREYLASEDKRLGEDKLVQLLSEFSCPLNPDVERFLKQQAIEFAKKHQAVTYLVLSLEDAELLGYFSITIKPLVVKAEPFSNTVKRKLARFSEVDKNEQTYNLAAYLIAQLGKNFNDKVKERITGQELLEAAIRQTQILQYRLEVWWHLWKQITRKNCFLFMKTMVLSVLIQDRQYQMLAEPHELIQLLRLL